MLGIKKEMTYIRHVRSKSVAKPCRRTINHLITDYQKNIPYYNVQSPLIDNTKVFGEYHNFASQDERKEQETSIGKFSRPSQLISAAASPGRKACTMLK